MSKLKWTLTAVSAEAKKYATRFEWQKASASSYQAARRRGWLDLVCEHMIPQRKKWTKSAVLLEAKKFSTRTEWRNSSRTSHLWACKNGCVDEAASHMPKRSTKWTKSKILLDAKNFSTRKEWELGSTGAVKAAKRLNIYDEATEHMERVYKKAWTKADVLAEAKNYATKEEWKKSNQSSLNAARRNGWVEEATSHMDPVGDQYRRCLYEATISGTDLVYIGLTFNFNKRVKQHLKSRRFIELANHYGAEAIVFKQLTDYIDTKVAAELENSLIEQYRSQGRNLLNRAKGGSVGCQPVVWTKEKVFSEAKKYTFPSQWSKESSSSYNVAALNNWLDEATTHMERKARKKLTKEDVLESAKQYSSKMEWRINDQSALNSARRNGWLKEAERCFKNG